MVTNYIKNATYKEIYDIHTDSESSSILTIHTPLNDFPRRMLQGFFTQYRKFKYRGATVSMRPAARLPADPEQISYEAGEPGIDPRDMLNPVLYRGYSGESLGTFLNRWGVPGGQSIYGQQSAGASHATYVNDGWYGNSVDKISFPDQDTVREWRNTYLEKLYYQSLSDPYWRKMGPQRGMKKFFYPLVYELATTTQRLAHLPAIQTLQDFGVNSGFSQLVEGRVLDSSPYYTDQVRQNIENNHANMLDECQDNTITTSSSLPAQGKFEEYAALPLQETTQAYGPTTNPYNRVTAVRRTVPVLTSHKRRLGWLDTDSVVIPSDATVDAETYGIQDSYATWPPLGHFFSNTVRTLEKSTTLPQINMGIFVFPKAEKQEMYWRLTITHHFDFSKYRPRYGLVSPFDDEALGGSVLEWSDWDSFGDQIFPTSSVTSSKDNVHLVDVEGLTPEEMADSTILPEGNAEGS